MNEILQNVLDKDFVVFKEKFKEKLSNKYEDSITPIINNFKENIMSEMVVNDGRKILKCKNCGAIMKPGIPVMGSCPECGAILT